MNINKLIYLFLQNIQDFHQVDSILLHTRSIYLEFGINIMIKKLPDLTGVPLLTAPIEQFLHSI